MLTQNRQFSRLFRQTNEFAIKIYLAAEYYIHKASAGVKQFLEKNGDEAVDHEMDLLNIGELSNVMKSNTNWKYNN